MNLSSNISSGRNLASTNHKFPSNKQRIIMDKLFTKLNHKSIFSSQVEIQKRSKFKYFQSIENQQEFMDKLFIKLNLNSIEDWINIPMIKLRQNGGRSISRRYKNMQNILSNIYPNYPWKIVNKKPKEFHFKSIENQREFMNNLFIKLKLTTFDDWINIKLTKIKKNGGWSLIHKYNDNLNSLLISIYPNYPWNFDPLLLNSFAKQKYFKSISNQRKYIDKLFIKFKLKSLDDWLHLPIHLNFQIGYLLDVIYLKNFSALLFAIYPNYPWDFHSSKLYYKSIENQRKYMDDLFIKLKLKSFDDWLYITPTKIWQNKGRRIIKRYKNNIKLLLLSIYPNFPWYFQSRNYLYTKIKEWIDKYNITQKKDWYRLPAYPNAKYELYKSLKQFYPSEKWKKENIICRNKKSVQRLLFAFTQKIYPSLLIFENYFHPKLISIDNSILELDIYIPALQLTLEYQGEQHYDDMPAAFAMSEFLQRRDEIKERIASDYALKIVYIPFWWDHSLSSLQSSLQSSVPSNFK